MRFITNKIMFRKRVYASGIQPPNITYDGNQIAPNTPEWQRADQRIREHFNNRVGLDELVKSHIPQIPGVNHHLQMYQMNHYNPGSATDFDDEGRYDDERGRWNPRPNSLSLSYQGKSPIDETKKDKWGYPSGNQKVFSYNAEYNPNDMTGESKHLNFGNMYNHHTSRDQWDDTALPDHLVQAASQGLPQTIAQLTPFLRKANVESVRTQAVSNGMHPGFGAMNGASTWSKLGFGFDPDHEESEDEKEKYYHKLSTTFNDLNNDTPRPHSGFDYDDNVPLSHANVPTPERLRDLLGNVNHPLLHKDILKKEGYPNAAQAVHHTLNSNFDYHARLNLDPKDPGYRVASRMADFIGKKKGLNSPSIESPTPSAPSPSLPTAPSVQLPKQRPNMGYAQ